MAQSNSDYSSEEIQSSSSKISESQPERKPKHKRNRPQKQRLIALGAATFLVAFGFGGWRWWQSRTEPAAAQERSAQPIPVKLETVETATVQETSEFVGRLESPRSVVLQPEIQGRVSQIFVSEGDFVKAGTPLIQLNAAQQAAALAGVQANINSARAQRNNASAQLQALAAERAAAVAELDLQNEQSRRTTTLVREGALSQQQLDLVERDRRAAAAQLRAIDQRIQAARASIAEAEAAARQAQANATAAEVQLGNTTLTAPFSGIVGDIPVKIGQVVNVNDTLTSITQNQNLDLRLAIPLERRPDLRNGLPVKLSDTQGNSLGTGRISFIAPRVDAEAQSILAKATFVNSGEQLQDGQFVRAQVIWNERPGVLVPTTAVTRLGGETFVYQAQSTPESQLVARQIPVKLGDIQGNSYQVIDGLKAGSRIVVSGTLNLSDGAPIAPLPLSQTTGDRAVAPASASSGGSTQ